jgi:hypothetical protein
MITSVNYAPSYLQGVYNPIIWSVTSNQTTQLNFSYVFDVYINNTLKVRLKVKPNPSGVGMIDVSQICQSFLPIDIVPETVINSSANLIFTDNLNSSLQVFLKVGEEYGSPSVIYNGVTTGVVGIPAYNLYAKKGVETINIPVHVWNSSLEFKQQQEGMSNYTQSSGGYTILNSRFFTYDWGYAKLLGTRAYPLSNNLTSQKVYLKDMNVLSFINWSKYGATLNDNYIAFCIIRYYNTSGSLVNQYSASLDTTNGFSQKANCSAVIGGQLNERYDIVHVQCRLESLIAYYNSKTSSSIVLQPNASMSIQMYSKLAGNSCTPQLPISEEIRFTLLEDCTNEIYTRVRLSWLNDLGGRDYMNFTAFMEKETKTTNDNYYQETMNWSSSTPVPINVQNPNQNLNIKGGNVIYNKQAITSWMLNTDWLTQDEVNLLEGLQKSSDVLAYFNDSTYNQYAPYSVTIGQTSYKTKNIKQVKMVQGEFEISLNQIQKIN